MPAPARAAAHRRHETAHAGSAEAHTATINLPTALTLARIAAVPFLIAAWIGLPDGPAQLISVALFAIAAATDWLDGAIARRLGQESRLGALLDPIADKLLVAASLVLLVHDGLVAGPHLIAALAILLREVLVSGLREALAGDGVGMPVTRLAKWKTAAQLIAIGLLLGGAPLGALVPLGMTAGLALLWLAAGLTVWTGWGYTRVALAYVTAGAPRTPATPPETRAGPTS